MRFKNILKPPHLGEGYKIMPPMDKEKYPEMPGLEGPFTMMSGKVVYYDPKEGAYYDKDADMYMSYDEFQQHDNDYGDMKDERDEVKKEADELNIGAKGDRPYKAPRQPKRGDPINPKSKGVDPKVLNMFLTNSITEGEMSDIHAMISNADNPEEMVMDLVDKGGPQGQFLYGELEQLATEAGTTFNNAESMPEDFVDELLANMGIEGYTFEGAPKSSPRPKPRPMRVPRPKPRPTTRIGGMPGGSTRGIDPKDNYSPEDIKRLLMQSAMEDMNEGDYDQDTVKKNALEALVDIAKTAKKYKGGVTDEQIEILGGLIQDMDLAGIEPEKYSAVNELFKVMATDKKADMTMIQPAYAQVKKIDEDINEGEEKPYICVHAKKGKHECRAESSYAAAKKAAEHWGLKSTSGIDAHLAVDESMTLKNLTQPKRVIHTNKQNFRKNFAKRYTDMYPSTSTAEGHSPHKKGTKKYKAHMAAMHANEDVNQQYADVLKSKNQIKINAFLQGLDSATATRLTGGQAQTSKISSDGQSIRPSGDAYTHGKPGLSKQTIRMTKPVADRKYGESKLQDMRKALKLDESADANTVVAEYTRATLNHSYKTWKQVNEQITFIRSFVKEDVDVNAVATMLHKMHERENLDHKMLVKENVSKLRQIVKDKSAMSIKFADGSMKVDMTTASIFLQVFDKVKEETQAKIIDKIQTKAGFLSMLDLMYKKIG